MAHRICCYAIFIIMAIMIAGCFEMEITTNVAKDGSAEITVDIAMDIAFREMAATRDSPLRKRGWKYTEKIVGNKYHLIGKRKVHNIDGYTEEGTEVNLIMNDDGTYNYTETIDLSMTEFDFASLALIESLKYNVVMPSKIIKANADRVRGNTATWTFDMEDLIDKGSFVMTVKSKSIPGARSFRGRRQREIPGNPGEIISADNLRDILKLSRKGIIAMDVKGAGIIQQMFMGQALKMNLKNKTRATIVVTLPHGLIIKSRDKSKQDMILAKDIEIRLEPLQRSVIPLYVFCINYTKGGPEPSDDYTVDKMATGQLKSVIDYISSHRLEESYSAQIAVWRVTDPKETADIGAVYARLTPVRELLGYSENFQSATSSVQQILDDAKSAGQETGMGGMRVPIWMAPFPIVLALLIAILIERKRAKRAKAQ